MSLELCVSVLSGIIGCLRGTSAVSEWHTQVFVACRFHINPVDPSFRALSGRPKFTVRRNKFNKCFICEHL